MIVQTTDCSVPAEIQERDQLKTGVTELDAVIAKRQPLLVMMIAATGAGKTALCVQATSEAIRNDKRVLYVSTELEEDEFLLRFLAAHTCTQYDKISDGIKWFEADEIRVPCPATYKAEPATAWLNAINQQKKHVTFIKLDSKNSHLLEVGSALQDGAYDLCIFDWLGYQGGYETSNTRLEMEQCLREIAERTSTTILVTAQEHPESRLNEYQGELPNWQAIECKKQGLHSDLRITMSNYEKSDEQLRKDECIDTFEDEQHFHVQEIKRSIPFRRAFDIQRFENPTATAPREEDGTTQADAGNELCDEEHEVGREPDSMKEYLKKQGQAIQCKIRTRIGFVKMKRQTLKKLFELRNPAAVSVYTFLLLVARHEDSSGQLKIGDSYYERDKVSKLTGLTPSKYRTALKHLKSSKLIEVRRKEVGRGLIYHVTNYPHKDDKTKDFFKLYRNILEKKQLFRNPELFRIWIYFLSQASRKLNEVGLPPGGIDVYDDDITEACQISVEHYHTLRAELERMECIAILYERKADDGEGGCSSINIINWRVYQGDYVSPNRKGNRSYFILKVDL